MTQLKTDFFEPGREYQVRQDSEEEPFAFALAITSKVGFQNTASDAVVEVPEIDTVEDIDSVEDTETVEDTDDEEVIENVGRFSLKYLITGGEDDGKTFDISF